MEPFGSFIYKGQHDLLEDAQRKGLIFINDGNHKDEILDSIVPIPDNTNVLMTTILDLNGWIKFLKDIKIRTKNDIEYQYTEGLLLIFEEVEGSISQSVMNINDGKKEIINTKADISDDDMVELRKINNIDELLDPKNGFFK